VSLPPEDPEEPIEEKPVPGVRTPPLPPGTTLVWTGDATASIDDDQKDILIIDPARFLDVALWGRGPDLARAREALTALAATPAEPDGTPRVIAVADPASDQADAFPLTVGFKNVYVTVAAHVPAFPGMRGRPMYVVAADPMFYKLAREDPRLRPPGAAPSGVLTLRTLLWSSAGGAGIEAVTQPKNVTFEQLATADQMRHDAAYVATESARGYQVAIAGYLALLAILTLCIYAQRTAALRRPTDLMLSRVGLGPARIRRARTLEFVLLAAIGLASGVAGVLALSPLGGRLLDDQPGLLPRFAFELSPAGLAITAAAAVLATILAVALTTVRSASAEEDAYRDD
jgi:hypothetical protein